MAPSPGQRWGKKRTDARRGVRDLGVTFYVEVKKATSRMGGPKVKEEKESEVEKWASIGRQIAAAMGRADEKAREDEAYCRFINGEQMMVKEDQTRGILRKNEASEWQETRVPKQGLFSAGEWGTERRRRYEESRKLEAMLLERKEGWNARSHKVLYVREVENGLQRYGSCERQKGRRKEMEMRELVEKGVEMVKAMEKRPCLRWTKKLKTRMREYYRLKRESSFAKAREAVRESCVVEKKKKIG